MTGGSLSDLIEGFCPKCRPKLRLLLKAIADRLNSVLNEIRRSEAEQPGALIAGEIRDLKEVERS